MEQIRIQTVDPNIAFLRVRAVAVHTRLLQDRLDVVSERCSFRPGSFVGLESRHLFAVARPQSSGCFHLIERLSRCRRSIIRTDEIRRLRAEAACSYQSQNRGRRVFHKLIAICINPEQHPFSLPISLTHFLLAFVLVEPELFVRSSNYGSNLTFNPSNVFPGSRLSARLTTFLNCES